ncbi:MAG: hypothetical protein GY696_26110 [Gammaproteobacteria bacterium]|nr:hypothetical protein [Gammaproteobacteria bacterium]
MAGKIDDTENQRVIDRIKCIAFRETKDAGPDFSTKEWIGRKVKRGKPFAQERWQKSKDDVFKSYIGRAVSLSQESKEITNRS